MKRLAVQIGLVTLLLFGPAVFSGCAHPKLTPETPKAAVAMRADSFVVRVNELQAAVIQVCGVGPQCIPGSIDTNLARDIVQAMIDIRTVLAETPDGWQAAVKRIWMQIRPRFSGVYNVAIQSAFGLVDALVGAL
jgi:hypothetical protein